MKNETRDDPQWIADAGLDVKCGTFGGLRNETGMLFLSRFVLFLVEMLSTLVVAPIVFFCFPSFEFGYLSFFLTRNTHTANLNPV